MKLLIETTEEFEVLYEEAEGKKNMFLEGTFMQSEVVNRNGRIYPKAVLEKEVQRFVNEEVIPQTASGELGHPCFWENTEIMTVDNGWRYIKDISEHEEVFTLNKNTGMIEKQTITKKVVNYHKGKMFRMKNRTFDTCVTPDHRFVLVDRHGKYEVRTAQEIYNGFESGKFSHHHIPKTSKFNGRKDSKFTISGVPEAVGMKNSHLTNDLHIETNTFMAFMGYYLSEGCTNKRANRKNSYTVQIFQNEGIDADKIRKTLDQFPNEITWSERKIKDGRAVIWTSCDRRLALYLKKFGNCYTKYIDQEIKDFDAEHLQHLLDAFIVGDGRGVLNGKYTKCDVFSASYKLAEDLGEIAFKCGYAFRQYKQEEFQNTIIENRVIKAENKSTLHFVQILSSKGCYLNPRFMSMVEIDWDDNVYCVQVPNETFLAKDGGYSFWSANCGPAKNLDKICCRITSLKMEGNDVIGKALVLNTDSGKTVKNLIEGGMRLGMSSRALGSIKEEKGRMGSGTVKIVQPDFRLFAVDVVADPSAPDAFVDALMESQEWICEGGVWTPHEIETVQASINEAHISIDPTIKSRAMRTAYYNFLKEL